jgi:protein TonB
MAAFTLVACLVLAAHYPGAQERDVESPRWIPTGGARLRSDGPVLQLTRSPGLLRTEHYYTDFTIAFEFRLIDANAVATLAIRSLTGTIPYSRIPITNEIDGERALGRFDTFPALAGAATFNRDALAKAKRGPGEWQELRVDATRDAGQVFLDGVLVSAFERLPDPTGYITLACERGRVEIRNVRIVRHPAARDPFGDGALRTNEPGLVWPRLLSRNQPYYPDHLRSLGLEGRVVIEAVIERDGSVGDVRVLSSNHRDFDESAVGAVRRWRFEPATRDGMAVAAVGRFEIDFQLRK